MLVPSSGAAKILNPGPSPRGWHRLQLAAECLQKYAWAYKGTTGKVDMKSRPALARGSLFHLAMAQHYARMRNRQNPSLGTPDDWCEPEEAVELMAKVEGVESHIQAVLDTYQAYQRHFSDDEWRIKVLAVEELAQTTIGGKYLLTGRLDLAVEDAVGQVHVWDHKCLPSTTSVITSSGIKTVGELLQAGTDWTCAAWDEQQQKAAWAAAGCPVDAGEQDVYRVTLGDGSSESYGYRHPLLTERGWVQAADLKVGDWVAVAEPPPRGSQGVRWVQVVQHEFTGRERCYDITVPQYHTFLTADGVVTHNTTGRLTASHKSYYAVSGQLIGYSHMARQVYGERYAGLTVNLVQFANRGPDDAKFERIPLPRSPNMEARFERTVMDIEESIARMEASGRAHDDWPKAMNEMSCFGRYGACNYLDQCRHGAGSAAAGNWVWDPGA